MNVTWSEGAKPSAAPLWEKGCEAGSSRSVWFCGVVLFLKAGGKAGLPAVRGQGQGAVGAVGSAARGGVSQGQAIEQHSQHQHNGKHSLFHI